MAVLKEVCARGEKYTTRDGQEKQKWIRCGNMIETKNGPTIKLDNLPITFDGWLHLFDVKEKDGDAPPQRSAPRVRTPGEDDGSETPF